MLSACQTVSEETKTVGFYLQNEVQRKEKIAECNNNPGELAKTPNCINAGKAQMLLMSRKPASKW